MGLDYTASRYLPVSWEQLHRDSRLLAARLVELDNINAIYCITRGGLVPGAIAARELEIRNMDVVCIASYEDRRQGQPRVIKHPDEDGEGVVIIDDLVDSGKTLEVVRELMPRAHIATVYAKPLARERVDTFVVPVEQDVWLLFPWEMEMQPNTPLARQSVEKPGG